jgi:hypothetical protein
MEMCARRSFVAAAALWGGFELSENVRGDRPCHDHLAHFGRRAPVRRTSHFCAHIFGADNTTRQSRLSLPQLPPTALLFQFLPQLHRSVVTVLP